MHIVYECPKCQTSNRADLISQGGLLQCNSCPWNRVLPPGAASNKVPERCVVCGCSDLWRQKDFPQGLGLLFVALGALISTIAWAYHMPLTALGTLMSFAALDLLLYVFMRDVLVCYRCHARYRDAALDVEHPRFNLETAERYRQEAARRADARQAAGAPSEANKSRGPDW